MYICPPKFSKILAKSILVKTSFCFFIFRNITTAATKNSTAENKSMGREITFSGKMNCGRLIENAKAVRPPPRNRAEIE
jgi:hypothetical protein